MRTRNKRFELWGAEAWLKGKVGKKVFPGQRCWLNGAAGVRMAVPPSQRAPWVEWLPSDMTLSSQAAQNLIVLAREEAGAEKIFQSDGVRLLTQLLDTAKADLMLAALRTLVGLCSGHRSRVGPAIAQLSCGV